MGIENLYLNFFLDKKVTRVGVNFGLSLHFSTISRNISQISPNTEVIMSNKTFLLARASNFCWPIHQLLYNLSGCIVNLSKINSLINRYKVSVDKKVTSKPYFWTNK